KVDDGRSRRDKLPIRLLDNGKHLVKGAREIENGGHDATRAEAGVERAIAVVACQREIGDTVECGHPSRKNLPVRLHGNGTRGGTGAPEIGGHFASHAEAGVERAARLSGTELWSKEKSERQ